MTPEQREELKRAAMNATPGPWHSPGLGELHAENHDEIAQILYAHIDDGYCGTDADADYMARAHPAAILSLIAQVEALTGPQGWKCVPMNPVVEQVSAGQKADWNAHHVTKIYQEMLEAAPTIPAILGTKEGA